MLTKVQSTFRYTVEKYKLSTVLVALVIFWMPVVVFAHLADEVLEREPIGADTAILHFVHTFHSGLLDHFFLLMTNLGSAISLSIIAIVIAGYLVYRRSLQSAAIVVFGVGGAAVANLLLKALFQRDRPDLWTSFVIEHSFSFPSGHAMASSAFALSIILIAWRTRWRWWAVVSMSLFALLVGVSRLYFGVHYPTDVVAGWCVSAAWVVLASSLISNFPFALRGWATRLLRKAKAIR